MVEYSAKHYQAKCAKSEEACKEYAETAKEYADNAVELTSNKADTDLSNVDDNIDYVVESYQNGTNWYRLYKSGWCEQGGKTDKVNNTSATVSFLRNFANTNSMSIKIQPIGGDNNNWAGKYFCVSSFTASNFTYIGAGGAASGYFWEAKGYAE